MHIHELESVLSLLNRHPTCEPLIQVRLPPRSEIPPRPARDATCGLAMWNLRSIQLDPAVRSRPCADTHIIALCTVSTASPSKRGEVFTDLCRKGNACVANNQPANSMSVFWENHCTGLRLHQRAPEGCTHVCTTTCLSSFVNAPPPLPCAPRAATIAPLDQPCQAEAFIVPSPQRTSSSSRFTVCLYKTRRH